MKRAILLTTSSISAAIAGALATIALVLVTSGSNPALATSTLNNGNFETGDLSGWTVDTTNGGDASAASSYTVNDPWYPSDGCCPTYLSATPHEGSYFAQLTPGGQSEDTTISQPFTASNGDRVSGWVFTGKTLFQERGYETYEDDNGQVVLTNGSGTTVATLFEDSGSSAGDYGSSAWKYWEYTFTDLTGEGQFQIEAKQSNLGRTKYIEPSVLGLDDVKISTLGPDSTKPSTSATRSVEPNAAEWNKEDVTVKLKATDNEGGWGVKEITYSINGGEPTTEVGDSVEVPAITDEGKTTIRYYATDEALNSEDEQSLEVKIDKTPPRVATNSASPADTATPSATISIRFLESGSGIKLSSLNNYGFEVYKATRFTGTERVSGTISYDAASKTATFTPKSRLGKGTYYAWVNAWYVRDKAENVLADTYTWSFSVR